MSGDVPVLLEGEDDPKFGSFEEVAVVEGVKELAG